MKKTWKQILVVCSIFLLLAMAFVACEIGEIPTGKETDAKTTEKIELDGGFDIGVEAMTVTVEDGYLVVNGVKTEYEIYTDPVITVEDGYVVVNGAMTEYKVDTNDVVTVKNGYLVVNGVKTEHKVYTDPIITVKDGYVVVNGVETEHKVYTAPVITVEDGYVVVNGVKTEYAVTSNDHSFSAWELYNEDETDCEKKLYYRVCSDCADIEWKDGKYADHTWNTVTTDPTCQDTGYDTKTCTSCGKEEICNETPKSDHKYKDSYSSDGDYHWVECLVCGDEKNKEGHVIDDEEGICMVCDPSVQPTEGIVYDLSADGTYAEVIGYSGTATKIKIADEYNGLPVKTIYSAAFKNQDNIVSVVIPDSVTSIGSSAFQYCSNLTSVTFGKDSKLTSIGYQAFSSCSSLTSIDISDSVTSIGDYAFQYCSNLTSVTFGEDSQLTSISDYAFQDCYSLTSIDIPDSVTSIGYKVFYGCNDSLFTEYEFGKYIGSGENPYYFLYSITNKNLSTYQIHEDTKVIGSYVFSGCERLGSITIPDGVTSIGNAAFYNCSNLTSIDIPDSVTSIGSSAFYYCSNLTSVTFGEDSQLTSIGSSAFLYCSNLTSIVIPDSVTSIGESAFNNSCTSLTSIYYMGTYEDWCEINIGNFNYKLSGASRYYYSATKPTDTYYRYWRYVDGVPTVWDVE